jgi:uncharacterized protein YjbI with pentapeptide repeats
MADPEHVAKLLEGVEAWNEWRQANPNIKPDLQSVDFTADDFRDRPLYTRDAQGKAVINLRQANLQGAILDEAQLRGADLTSADLTEANLRQANLRHACLMSANLQGAYVQQGKLESANLAGANLQWALLPEATFEGAKLICSNLQRANLLSANLRGATLYGSNLCGADLRMANLELANLTGVKFDRSSRQRTCRGIRAATCYGSQIFKSFAQDQDYIEELRDQGHRGAAAFWIWWLFADCGRSLLRWACWSIAFAMLFGLLFFWMGENHFRLDHLPFTRLSMVYYSVVTFTTLGFGDIKPASDSGMVAVMAEVILGYVMLGGLISILANKLARRS